MMSVKIRRFSSLILILILASVINFNCSSSLSAKESNSVHTQYVIQALRLVRTHFYDPSLLDDISLLNAALQGAAESVKRYNIDPKVGNIVQGAKFDFALEHFCREFNRLDKLFRQYAPDDDHEIAFNAVRYLVQAVNDSHTNFYRSSSGDKLTIFGIGAIIKQLSTGEIYLAQVYPNCAASLSGLRQYDQIIAINGDHDLDNLNQVVVKLRGNLDTVVKITVKRQDHILDFTVYRLPIIKPVVDFTLKTKEGHAFYYLKLEDFWTRARQGLKKFSEHWERFPASGVIVDLRGNGGGWIATLNQFLGYFFPPKTDLYLQNKASGVTTFTVAAPQVIDQPVVVLVDGKTGSAAAMFAAILKERRRAIIVGAPTGRNINIGRKYDLPFGSSIRVTTSQFLTLDKFCYEKVGVTPHVEAIQTEAHIRAGVDYPLERAIEILIEQIRSNTAPMTLGFLN